MSPFRNFHFQHFSVNPHLPIGVQQRFFITRRVTATTIKCFSHIHTHIFHRNCVPLWKDKTAAFLFFFYYRWRLREVPREKIFV